MLPSNCYKPNHFKGTQKPLLGFPQQTIQKCCFLKQNQEPPRTSEPSLCIGVRSAGKFWSLAYSEVKGWCAS